MSEGQNKCAGARTRGKRVFDSAVSGQTVSNAGGGRGEDSAEGVPAQGVFGVAVVGSKEWWERSRVEVPDVARQRKSVWQGSRAERVKPATGTLERE